MPTATASIPETSIVLRDIHLDSRLSHETHAFAAEIYLDDRHLASVENDGRGGCNLYRYTNPQGRDVFQAAVREWVTSDEAVFEAEDLLVGQLLDHYIELEEANRMRRDPGVVAVIRVDRGPSFSGSPRKGQALYYAESMLCSILDGDDPAAVAASHSADHWAIVADWRQQP